jgi:indolepyruvate decarboxylase
LQQTTTVGQYLLQTIKNLGVQTVYGIPGDVIIPFFKQIEADPALKLVTLSHEPGVGFAAIGAARATQKPQVACITSGPGAFNMVNPTACAYAERVPLIVIAGGPSMTVRESGFIVHHNVKDPATQRAVYSEVTAKAIVLDNPKTATAQIAEALAVCLNRMLPVYIEIPADMAEAPMVPPQFSTEPNLLRLRQFDEANAFIHDRFSDATKPVFMIGVEAVRYGLVDEIVAAAQHLNVPVVSTMLSRDYTPKAENYFGVYLGDAGSTEAKALVDASDFVLMLGEEVSDVNFGAKAASIRSIDIVRCVLFKVKANQLTFEGVPLKDLVSSLHEAAPKTKWFNPPAASAQTLQTAEMDGKITADGIIDTINHFFTEQGELPTVVDTGEMLFATLRLQTQSIVGSSFYGTMGIAAPAVIGYALASQKRPVALVGDGAFQMTGQEISHCPKLGINPIFIVSNNREWGMEQQYHPSAFNLLADWPYAKLAELWGGKSYVCGTQKELKDALLDAKGQKMFCLIEVQVDETKPPQPLVKYISEQKPDTPKATEL